MPASKPNQIARIAIPIVLLIVAVALGALAFLAPGKQSGRQGASQNSATNQPAGPEAASPDPAAPGSDDSAEATPSSANAADESESEPPSTDPARPGPDATGTATPAPPAAPGAAESTTPTDFDATGLRARTQPSAPMPVLGSLDPDSGHMLQVSLAPTGAGFEAVRATNRYVSVADRLSPPAEREHYVIQERTVQQVVSPLGGLIDIALTPMATRSVLINNHPVDLHGTSAAPVWRLVESTTRQATLEAEIVDADDTPVATITKTVRVDEGSHLIRIAHSLINHTDSALTVQWVNQGPLDMPTEAAGAYGGTVMRVRFGYLLDPAREPTQVYVEADRRLQRTSEVVNRIRKGQNRQPPDTSAEILWPDESRFDDAGRLVWFAQTSRYFATAVLPDYDAVPGASKALSAAQTVSGSPVNDRLILAMFSAPEQVAPGGTLEQSFNVFAGPISRESLSANANPIFPGTNLGLNLRGLLVYNYGGPCSFCTFQWLASPLLSILRAFHAVTFDWAIAIIMLVLCVRTILHPITRKAQISMLRFGKQMQKIAPKQQKIREKYKNDPKQMQVEVAKLMREEGVNPVGMLGCLPMFLQTPVWIALYAMLGFAIELRHEPAFYGLFQALTGNHWQFLADLSSADAFIPLPFSFNIPLLSGLMGPIDSINILPLLLGVVFFIQQKYLAPPTSATLTPEQESQQKIIKVMMVIMFPVFIYNAPSGLALYFITNSTIAIFESRWIRSHADKMDLTKPTRTAELLRKQVENRAKARQQQPASPFNKERDKKRYKDR
ncbi:MAG: YidC/Oxa1 family insertase periplasmic-domain containing protein [Phycisphaerales bacterium]